MVVYKYSVKMFFVEEQGRLCYAEDWVAEGKATLVVHQRIRNLVWSLDYLTF